MRMRYCPRCASLLQERRWEGRQRQVCTTCGFVNYENPVPAAGCLVQRGDQVLLVQRRFEPNAGGWTLPAGFIEWGETPEQAAVRETQEETGLRVRAGRLLGVYPWYREFGEDHPNDSGVLIIYAGEVLDGHLHAGDDAQDVGWFASKDLPAPIAFASHRAALAQWAERRTLHGNDSFSDRPSATADAAPTSQAPKAGNGDG